MDFTPNENNVHLPDGVTIVQRGRIVGTGFVHFHAWRKESALDLPKHYPYAHGASTITYYQREVYYQLGTEDLPRNLRELPSGPEKVSKIGEYRECRYDDAYTAILEAFPGLAKYTSVQYKNGKIEIYDADLAYDVDEASGYNSYLRNNGIMVDRKGQTILGEFHPAY